ncbi:MAG: outer membrane protein assembly factor BamC [Kofleriaceae bacterium]
MCALDLRLAVIAAAVVVVLGSASGPKSHPVQPTVTIQESYDDTWTGLLEVFAARRWAIGHTSKESGILTTDWIEVEPKYADCPNPPLGARTTTQARFNVIVKLGDHGTAVTVTPAFRQRRGDPAVFVECESRGSIELTIHNEVAAHASTHPQPETVAEPLPAPRNFHCASSPSTPTVSFCAREAAECDRGRGALAAAVADITACAPVEAAWCFDGERCGATREACAAQRAAANAASECSELR